MQTDCGLFTRLKFPFDFKPRLIMTSNFMSLRFFTLGSSSPKRSWNEYPPGGLIEDLPYLETFLSDHLPWNKRPENLIFAFWVVAYVRFDCKLQWNELRRGHTLKCETIMRLEINFLVFNCQKNYQSQTPLLLWTSPVFILANWRYVAPVEFVAQ